MIAIASDHAGFILKEILKKLLEGSQYSVIDYGTHSGSRTDYPDYIHPLAKDIESGKYNIGVIICGSGNGVSMTANKYQGVRAALCWSSEIARLARAHNDANILALPARFVDEVAASEILQTFLNTGFEGGRHADRVKKICKQ